jgi:predicted DNA-binding transcriptional regulator AlpA
MTFDSKTDDLLTAEQVAQILKVRTKEVYELPLQAVRLSPRRLRWPRSIVEQFIATRGERR